jgi:predicted MPP superfamily phosphohydrolase
LSPFTRRNFIKAGAAVIASSALAVEGKAIITGTEDPRLVSIDIPLARLPAAWDGLTIVQLSDFHYDPHLTVPPISKAIEITNRLQPDLIVLTGDFVTIPPFAKVFHNKKRSARVAEPCAALLAQLSAPLGVFAVLGNHDAGSDPEFIVECLQANRIQVMRNSSVLLERQGKRLWLAGVDDVLEGNPDLDLTMKGIPSDEAVIALVHEPDYARRVAKRPVDLQLSGHTHGGQIVLPLVGPPYLPPLGRRYPKGLYRVGSLTLYTNVGLGTIRIPVRLNCPSEVTLIRLRAVSEGKPSPSPEPRT